VVDRYQLRGREGNEEFINYSIKIENERFLNIEELYISYDYEHISRRLIFQVELTLERRGCTQIKV
jgi:hypothetical protein